MTLDGASVVKGKGKVGEKTSITIPSPKLWSTESPTLYDVNITAGGDTVVSYFGLRTFALGDGPKGKRPLLNGKFVFAAGFAWSSSDASGYADQEEVSTLKRKVEVLEEANKKLKAVEAENAALKLKLAAMSAA